MAKSLLKARGSDLLCNGKPYRAIGVNIPHLHQAWNGTWHHIGEIYGTAQQARQAMMSALADASEHRIAFVRFFAHPGYPKGIDQLYAINKDEYWRQMAEVIEFCRERRIGLIPSLNVRGAWPVYTGEPRIAMLDPRSNAYQLGTTYIREFVSRYKDDPVILMWEIENEAMLASDVDMEGQPGLPEGCFADVSKYRAKYSRDDSYRWNDLMRFYRQQTELIKGLDPNHLITSGDAHVRYECTSRRETFPDFRYRNDTLREWIANNLASQPEPLDVFSYHMYGTNTPGKIITEMGLPSLELHRRLIRATHAANAPVFIGEFGQDSPSFQADRKARYTRLFLDMLEQERVALAALWVWHFRWQPENDVRSVTHPELVRQIEAFNRRYADLG